MYVQGKNLATPASRPNRNRIEAQLGSHRHGRPSKLEFRKFGERHGGNFILEMVNKSIFRAKRRKNRAA
jgi:hypothetical protein